MGAGRRPVYEPDPHLPTLRRQLFDYLTELQRHVGELTANPGVDAEFRETLPG